MNGPLVDHRIRPIEDEIDLFVGRRDLVASQVLDLVLHRFPLMVLDTPEVDPDGLVGLGQPEPHRVGLPVPEYHKFLDVIAHRRFLTSPRMGQALRDSGGSLARSDARRGPNVQAVVMICWPDRAPGGGFSPGRVAQIAVVDVLEAAWVIGRPVIRGQGTMRVPAPSGAGGGVIFGTTASATPGGLFGARLELCNGPGGFGGTIHGPRPAGALAELRPS